MLVIQILLAVPKALRKKGIIFYGIGFAIRFNIKQDFKTMEMELGALEKIIIVNSACIAIGSTIYFLFFTKNFFVFSSVPFGEKIQSQIDIFIKNASLLDIYLITWLIALIIGLPHEYMHIYFGKRKHIRVKKMYIVTVMGFPLLFFVTIDHKNASPLQIAFVASGGLILNAMILSVTTILFLVFPNNIVVALVFYSTLIITVVNGAALLFYTDGGKVLSNTLKALNEKLLWIYIFLMCFILMAYTFLAWL